MLPDTDKPPVIVTRKDGRDVKGTMTVDEDQILSIVKELEKFTISKPNATDDIAEKFLNDPVARLQISDREIATDAEHEAVVQQPSKRRCKTKNLCVIPGKPIKPGMLVPLNVPSPPSVPALPALPFPLDMSVLSCLPVLPTNIALFQQLPSGQGRLPFQ